MDDAEFDGFADEYRTLHQANIAITGEEPEFFANYKIKALRRIAAKQGVAVARILDFGSGIGNSVPEFRRSFPDAELTCADVSQRSLDRAEQAFPGAMRCVRIADNQVPTEAATFDLTFSACVFHHIPHEEHVPWLRDLLRVTRPGGLLSVFEHNPLNPLTVRAVNTCPFDANAKLIQAREFARRCREAGWLRPRVRFHLFFPRIAAALRPIEPAMAWFPLGAQYSVTAVRGG